jgi:hypothetical protein
MIPANEITLLQRPVIVGNDPSQRNTKADLISLLATNHTIASPRPSNIDSWIKCMLEEMHVTSHKRRYAATMANGVKPPLQKNSIKREKDSEYSSSYSNTESHYHPIYTTDKNIVIQILDAMQNVHNNDNKQASEAQRQ